MVKEKTRNLMKYVVPAILSSICFFLFTIIDGIFVGNGVGTDGLGAVSLVYPFVMIAQALFMLATIGGTTIVAVRIGRHDIDGANQAFRHSFVGTIFIAVILCMAGIFLTDPICTLLGANGTFHEMAADYMFWYSVFMIPSGIFIAFQGFCRNDDSPILVSAAVIISTVLNIIGDYIFVFPLKMGLTGAAIATGLSQTIAVLIMFSHFIRKRGGLRFGKTALDSALCKKIIVRGLPECISQLSLPITTMCMNLVLIEYIGDIGVNAFSIISYIASFSGEIFLGTGAGLQPLIGHCYGEKNEKDMKYYFRSGIIINFISSVIINAVLVFVGESLCKLFGADAVTLDFTANAIPLYTWCFCVQAFNLMISTYLYSTKRSKQAIIINVLRSLVVNSLIIMILPMFFGGNIIWYTTGIFEMIVLAVAVILLKHSERNGVIYK